MSETSFFEELQVLLTMFDEAFPADGKRKSHIVLENGLVTITVWDKNSNGTVSSWSMTIDEDDGLMSFDDVIQALSKYVKDNRT